MKYWFGEYYLGLLLVVVPMCFLGLVFCDLFNSHTETTKAIVFDKSYLPSTTGTGVLVGAGSNGQPSTSFISTSTSEKYTLILKKDGNVISLNVSPSVYGTYSIGSSINLTREVGNIIGTKGSWKIDDNFNNQE